MSIEVLYNIKLDGIINLNLVQIMIKIGHNNNKKHYFECNKNKEINGH